MDLQWVAATGEPLGDRAVLAPARRQRRGQIRSPGAFTERAVVDQSEPSLALPQLPLVRSRNVYRTGIEAEVSTTVGSSA